MVSAILIKKIVLMTFIFTETLWKHTRLHLRTSDQSTNYVNKILLGVVVEKLNLQFTQSEKQFSNSDHRLHQIVIFFIRYLQNDQSKNTYLVGQASQTGYTRKICVASKKGPEQKSIAV